MNNLRICKSRAVPSPDMNPWMWIPMRVLCTVLCLGFVFADLSATALAQSDCPGIHVQIPNIRNSKGSVACALFSEPEGFPHKYLRFADIIVMTKIQGQEASCHFVGIKPGTYAIGICHDENLNGEIDTNFLGLPTEGYGFSSDAKVSFGAPSFSDAKFSYHGNTLKLMISLNY
ncbi:MAG: DUF2141 domain-containing protein [Planctomycetes bacterium]|nr:DUF2141 domain-containing protein [Planctomycetota bacterium]